jgi:rubrerythrin
MYETTEVIATYTDETEARAAETRLVAEGIEAVLTGATPDAASFSLFGRMQYAPIQLAVPRSQVKQALDILDYRGQEEFGEDWEELAESAIDGWICTNCDTEVEKQEPFCPECGTPRFEAPTRDDEDHP